MYIPYDVIYKPFEEHFLIGGCPQGENVNILFMRSYKMYEYRFFLFLGRRYMVNIILLISEFHATIIDLLLEWFKNLIKQIA